MADDDDWDTDIVEDQDEFNNFNAVGGGSVAAVSSGGERESGVPPVNYMSAKASYQNIDSNRTANNLEKEAQLEERERKQAVEIKKKKTVDYGFTKARELRKAQEKANASIKGGAALKVPGIDDMEPEDEIALKLPAIKPEASEKPLPGGSNRILDPELKEFFEESEAKTITEQAVDFLNAYWSEVGDQAEFIFSGAHRWFRAADMHVKGITLVHLYEEGNAVEYNVAAYFYEKLHYWVNNTKEGKVFLNDPTYEPSMLQMKTAIQLKKDFREKVDVSFDGKISFLEHLLYQYSNVANPQDFMVRRKAMEDEHEVIRKARQSLDEITEQIKKYEKKRSELEEGAKLPGVKGKMRRHELSMLDASPLAEALQKSLITAEAAVRLAVKHYKGKRGGAKGAVPEGSLWWMKRELQAKKEVVVPATLRRGKR